jgi:hypothetical protein
MAENKSFVVMSVRKVKTMAGVLAVAEHNLRQKTMKNKDFINGENTKYNEYTGARNREQFKLRYDETIKNANLQRKIQRNASKIVEVVISTSHEVSEGWENDNALKEKTDNYLHESLKYFEKKWGENIVSAAFHWDETTPHIHLLCIPLIPGEGGNWKYSSSGLIGGPAELTKLHTDFYEKVGKSYNLARGEEGSRASHEELKAFKAKEKKLLQQMEDDRRDAELALEQAVSEKEQAEEIRRGAEDKKKMTEAETAKKAEKTLNEASLKKQEAEEMRRRVEEENRRAAKNRQNTETERQKAELLKTQSFTIHGENLKRSAEISQKEQEQRKLVDEAMRGTVNIPPVPEKKDSVILASWRDTIQKKVDELTVGFKSVIHDLQSKIQEMKQTISRLQGENTRLKGRAERAEHDLTAKPIAEILSDRENRVQGKNNQPKGMSR